MRRILAVICTMLMIFMLVACSADRNIPSSEAKGVQELQEEEKVSALSAKSEDTEKERSYDRAEDQREYTMVTVDTKISDIIGHPAFGEYGRFLFMPELPDCFSYRA